MQHCSSKKPEMKAQCLRLDRISSLPQSIIETILCLLPLKEAGRTSILSKEWRYSWTKIPILEFDTSFTVASEDMKEMSVLFQGRDFKNRKTWLRCLFLDTIYRILLLHKGPIHECILVYNFCMDDIEVLDGIDPIIGHLLKHDTLKLLHLCVPCELPVSVFSFHKLTDLYLIGCGINHLPTFNGFGSLTTLYFDSVQISREALMYIVSHNPLLKRFTLLLGIDDLTLDEYSFIIELLKCLPVVEYLTLGNIGSFYEEDPLPRVIPNNPLVHLKYLCIEKLRFFVDEDLPLLALLLRSSSCLGKLKLEFDDVYEDTHNWKDYSDVWLDYLGELEIINMKNLKPHMEFVKLILAKSPVLELVTILPSGDVTFDEKIEMFNALVRLPPVSPFALIVLD